VRSRNILLTEYYTVEVDTADRYVQKLSKQHAYVPLYRALSTCHAFIPRTCDRAHTPLNCLRAVNASTTLDQFQFPQSINVRIARPLAPRPISDRARRHVRKVPVHSRYPASHNNYAVRLQARCKHTVMVLCTHNASLRPITGMRTGSTPVTQFR